MSNQNQDSIDLTPKTIQGEINFALLGFASNRPELIEKAARRIQTHYKDEIANINGDELAEMYAIIASQMRLIGHLHRIAFDSTIRMKAIQRLLDTNYDLEDLLFDETSLGEWFDEAQDHIHNTLKKATI